VGRALSTASDEEGGVEVAFLAVADDSDRAALSATNAILVSCLVGVTWCFVDGSLDACRSRIVDDVRSAAVLPPLGIVGIDGFNDVVSVVAAIGDLVDVGVFVS